LFFKWINNNERLTIVTASDTSHFESLKQLIDSIKKYEKHANLIVFDLGLKVEELKELNNKYNNVEINKFEFSNYPKHVNLLSQDNGAYAWKPIIIEEILNLSKGLVLWCDAGNLLTRNLNPLKRYLIVNGFYSPLSSENIEKWSHPKTLNSLDFPKNKFLKRNLNAAVIGIRYKSKFKNLIDLWKTSALQKDLILPKGANASNHRWDQTLLTLIYYRDYQKLYSLKTYFVFGIKVHQDID
jgi:hypothetical protein